MSKTIKYDTLAVFAGPEHDESNISPESGAAQFWSGERLKQFSRIQSSDFSFNINRAAQGKLNSFYEDEPIVETNFVDFNFSYYTTDGYNESLLGFYVDGKYSSINNLITGTKDYFVSYQDEDKTIKTISFGNGRLQNYSLNLSVNQLATSSVSVKCQNVMVNDSTSGSIPRLREDGSLDGGAFEIPTLNDPHFSPKTASGVQDISAISQGQIELDFTNLSGLGLSLDSSKFYPQTLNLSIDFPENIINKIGQQQPVKRTSYLPFRLRLSSEILATDQEISELQKISCIKQDVNINLYSPKCSYINEEWEEKRSKKLSFHIKNLKLVEQSNSVSIGNKKTINVTWESQLYDSDIKANQFLMSGNFGNILPLPYNFSFNEEEPIEKIIEYKNYYVDLDKTHFYLDFTGNYDIRDDEIDSIDLNFSGDTGIAFEISGELDSGINIEYFDSPTKYTAIITGLDIGRIQGYSGTKGGTRLFQNYTRTPFVLRSDSPVSQNIDIISSGDNNTNPFLSLSYSTNTGIPLYFHVLYNQADWLSNPVPYNTEFTVKNNLNTEKYLVKGNIKDDRNILLNPSYYDYFNFWIDAYRPEQSFKNFSAPNFITTSDIEASGNIEFNFIKDFSKKENDFLSQGFNTDWSFSLTTSGHNDHPSLLVKGDDDMYFGYYTLTGTHVYENFNSCLWFFAFSLSPTTNVGTNSFPYQFPALFAWGDDISGDNGIYAICSGSSVLFLVDKDTDNFTQDWFFTEATGVLDNNWHVLTVESINGSGTNLYIDNVIVNSGYYNRSSKTKYKEDNVYLLKNQGFASDISVSGYIGEIISSPMNLGSGIINDINEYLLYKWKI